MRTKGELKDCTERNSRVLATGDTIVIEIIIGPCGVIPTEEDIAHLVACWNAFEEGGLVEELMKACRAVIKAMNEPKSDDLNTEAAMLVLAVLEKAGKL